MTQQFSIAARNHGPGIAQERFDGMAGRGCLPFIAVEMTDVQEGLSDFLLCSAGPVSVEGLQHTSETSALLPGQAGIRRDGTAMQSREESANRLDTVETIEIERDHCDGNFTAIEGAIQDLEMLPVAERETAISVGVARGAVESPDRQGAAGAADETRRGLGQHHNARVFLRQPEYGGVRRGDPGIDREIATPTAAGYVRSAVWGLHGQRPKLQNRRHTLRCGEGTPMPGRMPSTHPDGHIPPKNARSMRQVSSRPPESSLGDWEDSGFPRGLS